MRILTKFVTFLLVGLFISLQLCAQHKRVHKSVGKHQQVVKSKSKKSKLKSSVTVAAIKKHPHSNIRNQVKEEANIAESAVKMNELDQKLKASNSLLNLPDNTCTSPTFSVLPNCANNSRIVTKTTSNKTEEASFGSTMLEWVKDKYSSMIDVLPNQISNVMLYRFIDDWYGVKYRMGGNTKKGIDCSAFVQSLYKYVFGTELLRTACMQFNASEMITNPADLKEGDLVFFKVNSSRISHVGVYLKNNFFVHSASSKGVSIANLTSAYWAKYFVGGGRVTPKS